MGNNTIRGVRVCDHCKEPIPKRKSSQARFCSSRCAQANYRAREPSVRPWEDRDVEISRTTVGAMGELIVAADLMERGYNVFRSMSPSAPFDLVAQSGDNLFKIEVRTATKSTVGTVGFSMTETDECDYYAAILHGEGIIYEPAGYAEQMRILDPNWKRKRSLTPVLPPLCLSKAGIEGPSEN